MATINDPNVAANIAAVKAASTAPVATDPALVVALSPNTSAVNLGKVQITDGTDDAQVTAASTAAVAADKALVVALSPNMPATGQLRTDLINIAGAAVSTAASGVQKVGVVGNAGATMDTAASATSAPTNLLWTEAHLRPSDLFVTQTAAVNTGWTLTLPAAGAGLFHYITSINIVRATNATATAAGAALTITTTNLPGSPVWTFGNASTAGGTSVLVDFKPTTPLKSSAANTATTIVAPAAGAGEILRGNVSYYTGP